MVKRRVWIFGWGLTGRALCQYWMGQPDAMLLGVVDSRSPEAIAALGEWPPCLDRPFYVGGSLPPSGDLHPGDALFISPGVAHAHPQVQWLLGHGLVPADEIGLFLKECTRPVIAITGSNGKSTVTTLVGRLLEALYPGQIAVGGNLGVPALALWQRHREQMRYYIIELSSFQLEALTGVPAQAVALLNLSPDHLDRHGTLEVYYGIKHRILEGACSRVWNREDPAIQMRPRPADLSFGDTPPKRECDYGLEGGYLVKGGRKLMAQSELKLIGRHNACNALAALALVEAAVGDLANSPSVLEAVRSFKGLEHRTEWVAVKQGVTWINDSKGTNVGATLAALEGLSGSSSPVCGKWIVLLGGDAKEADLSPLLKPLQSLARAVIVYGKDALRFEEALMDGVRQGNFTLHRMPTLERSVQCALRVAQPRDGVLLSPAAASLDQFPNFEVRGRLFKEQVALL